MRLFTPALLVLTGCFDQQSAMQPAPEAATHSEAPDPDDPDGAGITWIEAGDPQMSAARDRARAELPDFFNRLRNPGAGEENFVVKFDLGDREFIWTDELRFERGRLTGRLTNTPINSRFAIYQRVEIPEAAIIDWGYFRRGVMQGNYTTRVQLETMPADEAQELRASFGW